MFYYLQSIQPELLSIAKGTAQLGINQQNFYNLKIPVPSLECQKDIVEYCESNDTLIKQLEKEIENNKKQAELFITGIVKTQTKEDVERKTEKSLVITEINEVIQDASPNKEKDITRPKHKKKIVIRSPTVEKEEHL